jgi:hypothetical protein
MQISKKALVLGAIGIIAAAAAATAGTLAVFSGGSSSAANTFSTGAITLTTNMPDAAMTFTSGGGMMPGTTVTRTVVVTNGAVASATNQDLRYALTVTTTGTASLANALQLTVQEGDTADNTVCTAHTGARLYDAAGPGPLNGAAGPSANATAQKVFGDPAQGYQTNAPGEPNDHDRVLAHNTQETLCFTVTLPLSADNSAAGGSTTASFQFSAEQVLNNP